MQQNYDTFVTEFLYKLKNKTVEHIFLKILVYYSLTYLLTPWSTFLLQKLNGFQSVKKFPAFHGTRRFITAFTNARHLLLSWVSSIQSIPPHPTYWRSILILSSHPRVGLPSGLFSSGFPSKALYTPLLYPIRATCPRPSHSSRFYHPNNIGWDVQIIRDILNLSNKTEDKERQT